MAEIIVIGLIVLFVYHIADRIKNPEKWKENDLDIDTSLYIYAHQDAFKKIPESEWIVMSNISKSNVLRKREEMKMKFFKFPQATQDAIKERYLLNTKDSFDDKFPGVD